jgi:hypothetical protein
MPHIRTPRRKPAAVAPLIALAVTLVAATLGLAACGGSSSTTTHTAANAAATGTTTPSASATGTAPPGTSSTGTPGAPGRPNPARFTAMRACLAKKGITLPQRTPGVPGGGLLRGAQLPKGVTRAQYLEALKSCGGGAGFAGGHFGGGHFSRVHSAFDDPRFHQALVRFATCLRQNGMNVAEPNTSGKGPIFNTKGLNTGTPQFRAAETKCRTALFGALRPKARPGAAGSPTG